MGGMRIQAAALLFTIAASLPIARGFAQNEQPPEPEERTYTTPPAWKSVEIGNFYLRRHKYRAALSRYQEAAKTDPTNPQAYLGMGNVYDRLGLRQKALENYRQYLDLLPSTKQAEEAREVQKAIARLERRLRTSPAASSGRANSDRATTSPR
jgi:tetratricopeptide (TPR) repeat protein